MKQLIDFIPLIVFFVAYKMQGIYVASAALLGVSVVVYGLLAIVQRGLEKAQGITLVAVVVFCSLTLFFQNESILKWKAPIANFVMALLFLGSQFFGHSNLVKRMMGHVVVLPERIWSTLNYSWVMFFLITGGANLYVAFQFHEIWVDFKVFGSLAMTLVFMVLQAIFFLAKYVKAQIPGEAGALASPANETSDTDD